MVRFGDLRELATFERLSQPNEFESEGGAWQFLFREMVSVQPFTAREVMNNPQIQENASHWIRLLWVDGVLPIDRVKIARNTAPLPETPDDDRNFRIFNIESVTNTREQNRELELLCTEVV